MSEHKDPLVDKPTNAPLHTRIIDICRQLIADGSGDVVWSFDLHTERLTYVSDMIEPLTGFTRKDALRLKMADMFTPESYAGIKKIVCTPRPCDEDPLVIQGRFDHSCKNGSAESCEIRAAVIADDSGKPTELIGISSVAARERVKDTVSIAYEQLTDIVELLPDPTFVIDLDKRVIAWNHAIEILSGVPKADMLGRGDYAYAEAFFGRKQPILVDFVDAIPDHLDPAYKFVKRVGGKVYAESYLPSAYNGKGAHLWGVAAPLHNSSGRRWGAVEVIRDVSDRVQADDRLRESERKARAILDLSFGFLGLLTPSGRVVEINSSSLEFVGVRLSEVVGKFLWDTPWWSHSNEMQKRLQMAVQDAANGGIVCFEATHRGVDGTVRYIDFSLKPVKDESGQVVLLIPEGHDISERKRMERSLRESEEKYRSLFENAGDGIFLMQQDRFIDCNARTLELFGCSTRNQIVGKTPYDFSPLLQPDGYPSRELAIERITAALGGLPQIFEWIHTKFDGTSFPAEVCLNRLELGERTLVQAIVRDISKRKLAEEEQSKLQMQLNQSQKMEAVGQLAGGVAHDFNNMLSVITGRAEIMLMTRKPGDPDCVGLTEIIDAAHHSADLTRQLLTFARKQTVAPLVLDVNSEVTGMLKMLRRLIGERIELEWIAEADVWPVKIDPSQLNQLLANLCLNARDAISGPGRIVIKASNGTVDESQRTEWQGFAPGDYMMLSVSDNGCGMEKAVQTHIFDPFFTTKEQGKGTGLGLATVYGIVQQNKGMIKVDSERGNGATFTICLPRFSGADDATKVHADEQILKGNGQTILLVEDEAMVLGLVQTMLESLNYHVLPARTPSEALRLVETDAEQIHMIITDIVMPEMNGRQLAEQINAVKPGVKCLFITGYNVNIVADNPVLDDDLCLLQKPFNIRALASKVHEVLGSV
jgi:PAS domain S-box-containing protein